MTSLPSFVELLSSLGLSDDTATDQHRKRHTHGRTNSGGSSSSNASDTLRLSPHSPTERSIPEIRLSGRQQPGSISKVHRFSPYLSSAVSELFLGVVRCPAVPIFIPFRPIYSGS